MELDPIDTVEQARDARVIEQAKSRLNVLVAITVALLATFMGICKVKDDNIVQAMQQAQANKLDHWSFYQARNIREDVAKATALQLQLAAISAAPAARTQYDAAISRYQQLAAEQNQKKEELKNDAARDQRDYDAANFRDDQFDLSDAFLAISVALLAVTALTAQKWLYALSLLPTAFGVVMGLAGLLQWQIHPGWLVGLLT
jgi:LPS O-antigen subunit length determinant protein (WzzB/FepE family)